MTCPLCYDPVPVPRGCIAGGDGSHRSCLSQGFRSGLFNSIEEWKEQCRKAAAAATAATQSSSDEDDTLEEGEIDTRWRKMSHKRVTLPPGKYYIGDICYAFGDDPTYDDVWAGTFGGKDGHYTNGKKTFVVAGTAYGDGSYKGSDGREYLVDAGVIGIVNSALCNIEALRAAKGDGGAVYAFTQPVEVDMSERGIFRFRSGPFNLRIDTTGGDEDTDEEGGDEF